MEGSDRDSEGSKGGSGLIAASLQQTPPPIVSGNGGGGCGGVLGSVDKVKFTVSVRGHQWSSARHVNETLQEFAATIQRNARRLEFIEEQDTIQRLQLSYLDGSEPEDLDVDATLGDVIICMGNKQLVAIVNPTKAPLSGNGCLDAEISGSASPMRLLGVHQKPKSKSDTAINNYNLPPTSCSPDSNGIGTESPRIGPRFMHLGHYKPPYRSNHSKLATEPSTQGLKIAIPPADPPSLSFQEDRFCSFHADYATERLAGSLPPLETSRMNYINGKAMMCGGRDGHGTSTHFSPNPTPSPAELAQMLVRSSSHPHPRMQQQHAGYGGGAMPTIPGVVQCNRSATSTPNANGGFQSFASAMHSRLPMMPNNNVNMHCPHGATTNIALLAQFLASQLRAFVPAEEAAHPAVDVTNFSPSRENKYCSQLKNANPRISIPPPKVCNGPTAEKENYPEALGTIVENGSPKDFTGIVKLPVSGSHDKDESSSSANVNTTVAPSSDGVDSEHPNGHSDLVFLVNRRSKRGVGTHHLKLSDLSTYFHLSVVEAAKKLGVSQTTLKKACRKFGLKRWPGRKVRSLESTIHGLEHTIAVGQGAGLEELTEAYMRSEVSKLQQEMNQLVHGTPAQHSPAVRTADLYKRLYSRGWRSKYHNSSRHDLDLSNTIHENRPSELVQSAKKATETMTKIVNSACKVLEGGQANKSRAERLVLCEDSLNQQNQTTCVSAVKELDNGDQLRESRKETAFEEPSTPVNVPVHNGAGVNCANDNAEKSCPEKVIPKEKEIIFPERSPKRPKRECRTAAEGAVRQGLRSSTCAM
ncbi:uncharacterized protein [Physcomitrium patens]|uniref:RWP-RK domain-containing protein n=2 Tax=Physcomitrium patens TaxID=3218 RepID=A0A7I4B348_PHYPA|nr:uncharacterized protein LOC112292373 [Physcomitrium patens]|eukprot:XP_024396538.1 uncharacterized protein LOC112292373 [Physcomitrella patens]